MENYISYYINEDDIYNDEGDVVGVEEYWLIAKVFVQKEQRGQGIARKMMEEAIAEMQAKRPELSIKLWCEAQDKDTDQELLANFYESFGFDATGNGAEMEL